MIVKHIILANWKMLPETSKEAMNMFTKLKNTAGRLRSIHVILAPPTIFIQGLTANYTGNKIEFSAQKVSLYETGPHTGCISAAQFSDIGAKYALIGHGERDISDDNLRLETFLASKYLLTPIIYIGESNRDEQGKYLQTIRTQIVSALSELSTSQRVDVIFCYEPVFMSGDNQAMTPYEIHAMVLYIRKVLIDEYGTSVSKKIRILYAGSVNSSNITDILQIADLDGVGVGHASVDAEQFAELLKIANKA